MSSEISPGKSMLLQLREERHAAEQAKQEEFAFEARRNYEHSLKVREGLTGRARSGGQGGIFGGKDAAALPKQGMPRSAAPFAVSDSPVFERQQAKENYADQYEEYPNDEASYGGRGGASTAYGHPPPNGQGGGPPRAEQYGEEEQARPASCGSSAAKTADQYEAMLKAAEVKRIRNKTAPRSTALW